MRARVLTLAVALTVAAPGSAEAVVAVTGSSSRLPTGVSVTVKNTGSEEVRFLRMLFGPPYAVTPQTPPCQSGGPGEVFCPLAPGAFPPGGQLTLEQLVTPLFPDGTPIAGRASADGLTDVTFSVPGPAAGAPDLAVDLTGPDSTTPGATVRYTLTVTNIGSAASSEAQVRVGIGSSTGVGRSSQIGTVTPSDPRVKATKLQAGTFVGGEPHYLAFVATIPPLAPGASTQLVFDVSIETSKNRAGALAVLLFDEVGTRTLSAALQQPDPEPGANTDTLQTSFTNGEPAIDSTIRRPNGAPREIAGTASGDVGGVEVAVVKATGGAKAAAASCGWLASKRGTFRRTPASARRCRTPVWLKASGTRRWRLRLSRRLALGSYVVYSRAITKDGAPEVRFSAKDGNRVALTVR